MSESTRNKNEDNNEQEQEEIENVTEEEFTSSSSTPPPSAPKNNRASPHDLSQTRNRPPTSAPSPPKHPISTSGENPKNNGNEQRESSARVKLDHNNKELSNSSTTPPIPHSTTTNSNVKTDAKEMSRSRNSKDNGKSPNGESSLQQVKRKKHENKSSETINHQVESSLVPISKIATENVDPKLLSSSGGGKKKKAEKPSRLSVTVPGSPFESGANTECIQLLRQMWNVHEEAVQFLGQIRTALSHCRQELRAQENLFESSLREKRNSNATAGLATGVGLGSISVGEGSEGIDKVDGWIPLQIFIDGLKCISDSFSDIEKQFVTLSAFQIQCKLALFTKVKHAKLQVTQVRLSIMHGIQQFITVTLNLIASPSWWRHTGEEKIVKVVLNVFLLTEMYNTVGWAHASSSEPSLDGDASTASFDSTAEADPSSVTKNLNNNSSSTKLSSTTSVQVLVQIISANKNDSALLKLSLKPLSGTRLLHIMAQRRSTFASHHFSRALLSNFYSNPAGLINGGKLESCFSDEDAGLSPLGKCFSQCPSLLGRAAVKKTENGDQRLSRSTRTKMYSYFHEVLWTLTGEHSEDLLLWGTTATVPLVLQPLERVFALRNSLSLAQHIQESNLSPMLSAFDSVSMSLHSFSLLATWDEKMREAFDETYQVKRPEHIALVSKPEPSQWATEMGSKFGNIVTSCVSMIDPGGGNHPTVFKSARLTNEEESLGNEAQIFFRLEATLIYFKAWVVKRSKVWLNGWAMPQFLAISQREPALLVKLIKSRETILIAREFLLNHEDVSIRLSAKHRKACADDLRAALLKVQMMSDELLQSVGPVCSTLSSATLQSNMPPPNHWRGVGRISGLDSERHSNYVNIFIGRVIAPVIAASVELVPGPVQEAMGKQVVNAACDAWLQFILHKKIRFSEWGAVQLLRDFTAFREWIKISTELDKEARKAILQLEILKTCEGVAYLLLRNPGDVLGVGKQQQPSRKNRRVAPLSDSESSPVATDSSAEDDIPAEMYVPNQQMWLELRLRRGYFTPPCC